MGFGGLKRRVRGWDAKYVIFERLGRSPSFDRNDRQDFPGWIFV